MVGAWAAVRIPTEAMKAPVVVANVSRGVIAAAVQRYDTRVIEVTAPPEVLAARLASRGRETAGDVARRLSRTAAIPSSVSVETVWNDDSLTEGVERFVAALRRIVDATKP